MFDQRCAVAHNARRIIAQYLRHFGKYLTAREIILDFTKTFYSEHICCNLACVMR